MRRRGAGEAERARVEGKSRGGKDAAVTIRTSRSDPAAFSRACKKAFPFSSTRASIINPSVHIEVAAVD